MDPTAAYVYTVTQEDEYVGGVRELLLSFWPADGTASLYDPVKKRPIVRRYLPDEHIRVHQLRAGATIPLLSRSLKVVGYADSRTRAFTEKSTVVRVHLGWSEVRKVLPHLTAALRDRGIAVGHMRSFLQASKAVFELEMHDCAQSDVLACLEQLGLERSAAWQESRSGTGNNRAQSLSTSTATHRDCSLFVIKPHVVAAGLTADILSTLYGSLGSELTVTAVQSVTFTPSDAADLFEPYRGVTPHYSGWVKELSTGQALLVEVCGPSAVERVREIAGPRDPVIARTLRPSTVRASAGKDAVLNAVHVTDIPEDGPLESKFAFVVAAAATCIA